MSDKKKILFVNGNLKTGGAEKALVSLVNNIDFTRYEVDLFLFQDGDDYLKDLASEINVIRKDIEQCFGPVPQKLYEGITSRNWLMIKFAMAKGLSKLIGSRSYKLLRPSLELCRHYDVAIAFRPGFSSHVVSHCIKSERRLGWWHHGDVPTDKCTIESLIQEWASMDALVSVSNCIKNKFVAVNKELGDKMLVVPNLTDYEDVKTKSCLFNPFDKNNPLNIVSVGCLSPEKRFDIIIDVAIILRNKGLAFRWHIVGDGPLREVIKRKIEEASLQDVVIMHGNQSNPYPWMKHADIFVHPSPVESFGIVIVEALALETPCIAVNSDGASEILSEGGGLLTSFSAEEIANAIVTMNQTESLRSNCVEEGIKVANKYSPQGIIPLLEKMVFAC